MDDHLPMARQDSSSGDAEPLLDSVTSELKAEFARVNREAALNDPSNRNNATHVRKAFSSHPVRGVQRQELTRQAGRLRVIISRSESSTLYPEPIPRQELQYWVETLESTLEALAKLSAHFARSLQAILRTPLFLDGPELSGYKHRLR